jgi:hypothetical protein
MDYKLSSNFAIANTLNLLNLNSPFDFVTLKVVDGHVGDKKISLLFFLVIIKLKDWATHIDIFLYNKNLTSIFEFFDNRLIRGKVKDIKFLIHQNIYYGPSIYIYMILLYYKHNSSDY